MNGVSKLYYANRRVMKFLQTPGLDCRTGHPGDGGG